MRQSSAQDAMGARRDPACREGCEGGWAPAPPSRALQPTVCSGGAQQVALPHWREGCGGHGRRLGCALPPFPHLRAIGRFREHESGAGRSWGDTRLGGRMEPGRSWASHPEAPPGSPGASGERMSGSLPEFKRQVWRLSGPWPVRMAAERWEQPCRQRRNVGARCGIDHRSAVTRNGVFPPPPVGSGLFFSKCPLCSIIKRGKEL